MSEIFLQEDITTLLDNRFIVIIGDSIQRAVYKDLVLLLQRNKYLSDGQLRSKGEITFSGDKLIEGGQYGKMTNGVGYREVRQYQTDFHLIRFYFVTRCYNSYVESILSDLSKDPLPDVILMNSCLWDISRYGNRSVDHYKDNLATLFRRMKEALPETCLVIWNMTLPISKQARGGFLIPQVEYMNSSLRLDILEANFFVHKLALSYGFNTLDLHYYLRHQLQRRAGDGVHWDMTAHRRMTNLILSHVAQAWGRKPPENASRVLTMQRAGNANKRPIRAGEDFTFNCNANMNNNNNNRSKYSINNNLLPPSCNQNVQGPITNQININIANNYAKNASRQDRDQIKSQRQYLLEKPIPQLDPLQFRNLNNQPVGQTHAPARTNYNAYGRNNNAAAVPGMVHNDHFLPPGQFAKNDVNHYGNGQAENINRYGGPIRNVNFTGTNVGEMFTGQQFDWTPYGNQQLQGQWGSYQDNVQSGDHTRTVPYARSGHR